MREKAIMMMIVAISFLLIILSGCIVSEFPDDPLVAPGERIEQKSKSVTPSLGKAIRASLQSENYNDTEYGQYAPPWDVLEQNLSVILKTTEPTSGYSLQEGKTLSTRVIAEGRELFIYKIGYYYSTKKNDWEPFEFSQQGHKGSSWIRGTATKNLVLTEEDIGDGENYVAVYVCRKSGGWKCGCQYEGKCGMWTLQTFNARKKADVAGQFELSAVNEKINFPINSENVPAEGESYIGKYLDFDGNDYAHINNTPDIRMGVQKSFSVSAWFKTRKNVDYASILVKSPREGDNINTTYTLRYSTSSTFIFGIGDGTNYQHLRTSTPSLNEWHQAVGVYDGKEIILYIDGDVANRTATIITPKDNDAPLFIGSYGRAGIGQSDYLYNGSIGEVKIYKRALTSEEVREQYKRKTLNASVVSEWKFEGNTQDTKGINNGVESGIVSYNQGVSGRALDLSKSEGYVVVQPSQDGEQQGTVRSSLTLQPEGSISVWFKETGMSKPYAGIVAKMSDGQDLATGDYSLILYPQSTPDTNTGIRISDVLRAERVFKNSDESTVLTNIDSSTKSYQKGVWHHAVISWNESTQKLFVDGKFVGSANAPQDSEPNVAVSNFYIGALLTPNEMTTGLKRSGFGNVRNFNGSIDEIKAFNRQLTGAEVAMIYSEFSEAKLQGLYSFDDSLTDDSQSQRNGQNIGGVEFAQGVIGKALNFSKINQSINLGLIGKNLSALTIQVWVNPAEIPVVSAHGATILSSTDVQGFAIRIRKDMNGNNILFADYRCEEVINCGASYTLPSYFKEGVWNNVGVSFNGTVQKVFINGALLGEHVVSATPVRISHNNNTPLWIGNEPNYNSDLNAVIFQSDANTPGQSPLQNHFAYNGSIDELKIYYAALSESKFKEEFDKGYNANKIELRRYVLDKDDGTKDHALGVLQQDGSVKGLKTSINGLTGNRKTGYEDEGVIGKILRVPIGGWTHQLKSYYNYSKVNHLSSMIPDDQELIVNTYSWEEVGTLGYVANKTSINELLTPIYRARKVNSTGDPLSNISADHIMTINSEELGGEYKLTPAYYQHGYILDTENKGMPLANAFWSFDNTREDLQESPNGEHHLESPDSISGVSFSEGIKNEGLYFNGNSLIGIGAEQTPTAINNNNGRGDDNSSKDLRGHYITISAWIKPESVNETSTIARKMSGSHGGYFIELRNGQLIGAVRLNHSRTPTDSIYLAAGGTLEPNKWQHVAMTYNGNTLKIFVNGVIVATNNSMPAGTILGLDSESDASFGDSNYANELYIGGLKYRYESNDESNHRKRSLLIRPFKGTIDEVKIFITALQDINIREIAKKIIISENMEVPSPPKYPTAGLLPYEGRVTIGYDDSKGASQTNNVAPERLTWQGSFKVKEAFTIDGKRMSGTGWLQIFSPNATGEKDLAIVPKFSACTTHGNTNTNPPPVPKTCLDLGMKELANVTVADPSRADCSTWGSSAGFPGKTSIVNGSITICTKQNDETFRIVNFGESCALGLGLSEKENFSFMPIATFRDFGTPEKHLTLCQKNDKKQIFSTFRPAENDWFYTIELQELYSILYSDNPPKIYQTTMGLTSVNQSNVMQESLKRYVSTSGPHYYTTGTDAYGNATGYVNGSGTNNPSQLRKEGQLGFVSVNKESAEKEGLVPLYYFKKSGDATTGLGEDNFYTTVPYKHEIFSEVEGVRIAKESNEIQPFKYSMKNIPYVYKGIVGYVYPESWRAGLAAYYPVFANGRMGWDAQSGYDTLLGVTDNKPSYTEGLKKLDNYGANALTFDGNDALEIPDSDYLDITGDLTISLWVYLDKQGTGEPSGLIVKQPGAWLNGGIPYMLGLDETGKIIYSHKNSKTGFLGAVTYITEQSLPKETWTHITMVRNGTSINILVNGEKVNASRESMYQETEKLSKPSENNQSLFIGASGRALTEAVEGFKGALDEIKIYKRALTKEEILRDYWSIERSMPKDVMPVTSVLLGSTLGSQTGITLKNATIKNDVLMGITAVLNGSLTPEQSSYIIINQEQEKRLKATQSFTLEGWYYFDMENEFGTFDNLLVQDNKTANTVIDDGQTDFGLWRIRTSPSGVGDKPGAIGFGIVTSSAQANRLSGSAKHWWINGTTTIEPRKWYHVSATYDNTTRKMSLYINSQLESSMIIPQGEIKSEYTNNGTLTIGSRNVDIAGTRSFKGKASRVRMYNRTLSTVEIGQHYSAEKPLSSRASYNFDNNFDSDLGFNFINWVFDGARINTSGMHGNALQLVGGTSHFRRQTSFMPKATAPFTLELWMKPSENQDWPRVGVMGWDEYVPTPTSRMMVVINDKDNGKNINFVGGTCVFEPAETSATESLWEENTWQHIIAVGKGDGKIQLYKNGEQIQLKNTDCTIPDVSQTAMILLGAGPVRGQGFTGLIDDAIFYNTALTSEEIKRHYYVGLLDELQSQNGNTDTGTAGGR
ncbi:LamG domain-containing protein [Candidatus Woesearchaeota archaeon]|nr:LamG domain-containing protein [Candidatus Woesearchaeota archaeon]